MEPQAEYGETIQTPVEILVPESVEQLEQHIQHFQVYASQWIFKIKHIMLRFTYVQRMLYETLFF